MPDPFGFVGVFFTLIIVMIFVISAIGFVVSGVAVPAIIATAIGKKMSENAANDAAPLEAVDAVVVAKRMKVQGESSWTHYYVTFETPDGGRREFSMTGEQYGLLVERDSGRLTFQRTRYQGFERSIVPS